MKKTSLLRRPIDYDDALITSVIPYADSDCIVRMFSRKWGRIVAFGRRARAYKKSNNSPQAPALARVGLLQSSQKLARLVSCELDLDAIMFCSPKIFGLRVYVAEIIEKLLPLEDPAQEIFLLIEETYAALNNKENSAPMLRAFELKLLAYCGYLPEMPQDYGSVTAFDTKSSCFVSKPNETSFPFSPGAIKLAKAMLIAKIGEVNYGLEDELLMIGRIFQSRLKVMGLFPLKSVAFLKQISARGLGGNSC